MATYKGLRLRVDEIEACLTAFGVSSLVIADENESGKTKRVTGRLGQAEVFARLFLTDKGVTIGAGTGKDPAVFEAIADEIVDKCSYGGKQSINLSIKPVSAAAVDQVEHFLIAEGATRQFADDATAVRVVKRWQGPRGDKLAITYFPTTNRVLLQGVNAHLASMVLDMFRVLLPSEVSLEMDIDAFEIPVSVAVAKEQAEARLPHSHGWISESVRRQLSSALVLCQTAANLEDYAVVAFPALRGLEGFIKQVYCAAGSRPAENVMIGEWFEKRAGAWAMCAMPALHVGALREPILAAAYGIYHAQRHSLMHMSFDPAATRELENLDEARQIVNQVCDFIDSSCAKLRA
jgi:hypothetical protein